LSEAAEEHGEDYRDGDEEQGSPHSEDEHRTYRKGGDSRQKTRHPVSHAVDYNISLCVA